MATAINSYGAGVEDACLMERSVFRCVACNKLLARGNAMDMLAAEIKCPRCGLINER